jgi:hypothetical protein
VSTPDDLVRAQIEQIAASTSPADVPDLTAAVPAVADVDELTRRIQELEDQRAATVPPAPPVLAEPDDTLRLDGNAPGYMVELVATIERRLRKLEGR